MGWDNGIIAVVLCNCASTSYDTMITLLTDLMTLSNGMAYIQGKVEVKPEPTD